MNGDHLRVECGVSKNFSEKTPLTKTAFTAFKPAVLTVGALAWWLQQGRAICTGALSAAYRTGENVSSVQIVGADFDNAISVETALNIPLVRDYAAIVYPTASSTPLAPRSRALFILDQKLDVKAFADAVRRVLNAFGTAADAACTDPARVWFGSLQPGYVVRPDRVLPVSVVAALPLPQTDTTGNGGEAAALPVGRIGHHKKRGGASEAGDALLMAIMAAGGVLTNVDKISVRRPDPDISGSAASDLRQHQIGAPSMTAAALPAFYFSLPEGRNNALFDTARLACRSGIVEADCAAALVETFAAEPPRAGYTGDQHATQSIEARRQEARRTIRSAYGYGLSGSSGGTRKTIIGGSLPNVIREWLTQHKLTPLARVLEALIISAAVGGQVIRAADVVRVCEGFGINQKTARRVLTMEIGGIPVFERTSSTAQHTPESTTPKKPMTSCGGSQKFGAKNQPGRGRPSPCYLMPTISTLAAAMGITVEDRPIADTLDPAALRTSAGYRQALHAAYIQRRAEKPHSQRHLAARIGVSTRTIRRYNRALGVTLTPYEIKQEVTRSNARGLLEERQGFGGRCPCYLATDDGRRYPPAAALAWRFINQGQSVRLVERRGSFLHFESAAQAA